MLIPLYFKNIYWTKFNYMGILLKRDIPVKRKVFFSFHFEKDFWRTQQVRNIGSIEKNSVATPNNWEEIKRKGDTSIKNWIDTNLSGKSCLVVLVGEGTANRKWIDYEIKKAWDSGKGVVGIRIHNLNNQQGKQSKAGKNPFEGFTLCEGKKKLSNVVKLKSPTQVTGPGVYKNIADNLGAWIEEAIKIRKEF